MQTVIHILQASPTLALKLPFLEATLTFSRTIYLDVQLYVYCNFDFAAFFTLLPLHTKIILVFTSSRKHKECSAPHLYAAIARKDRTDHESKS